MTPETLNRYYAKWPEVNIFFSFIYSSQNVLELYLVNGFCQKNVVLDNFSIKKSEHPPVSNGIFV
jgi:hypothetical protein